MTKWVTRHDSKQRYDLKWVTSPGWNFLFASFGFLMLLFSRAAALRSPPLTARTSLFPGRMTTSELRLRELAQNVAGSLNTLSSFIWLPPAHSLLFFSPLFFLNFDISQDLPGFLDFPAVRLVSDGARHRDGPASTRLRQGKRANQRSYLELSLRHARICLVVGFYFMKCQIKSAESPSQISPYY